MKVLLVVDVQKDFCKNGALAVPDGDQVVDVVNDLMLRGAYDLVIASKDWHPANHKSFASNHTKRQVFEMVDLNGLQQTLWPNHCVQNSIGSHFHPKLKSHLIDQVIYKGTDPEVDSYSAFFDNGRRNETTLRAYLEAQAAQLGVANDQIQISVCGLATDYCVGFTARDAASLGYKTEVVVDGCRAVNLNPDDEEKMIKELTRIGVRITESRMLLPHMPVEMGLGTAQQIAPEKGIESIPIPAL